MVQIYHFYEGKANNPMIVCGVLKSFSTFILFCKMKLGCSLTLSPMSRKSRQDILVS